MAEPLGTAVIEIRTETARLRSDMERLKSQINKDAKNMGSGFGNAFGKALSFGALLVAAKKALDFGVQAKNAARDAEEIRSKFDTVFISLKKEANTLADNFAKNFGIGGTTAREMLAATGDLLVGFRFTEAEALKLSERVGALSQDLASFQNYAGGAAGANKALTSAMLGETEAAKALGIVIRQDTKEFKDSVQALMTSKNLTLAQARAIVILDEAYKQSGKAVGDYQRTKDSLTNTERRVNEAFKEQMEVIGKELNHSYTQLIKLVVELSSGMSQGQGVMTAFGASAKVVATALITLFAPIMAIATAAGTAGASIAALLTGDFKGAANISLAGGKKIVKDLETMADTIIGIWKDVSAQTADVQIPATTNTEKNIRALTNAEEKAAQEKLDIQKEFYNQSKILTLANYQFQLGLIDKQVEELRKAGIKEIEIERWKTDQINKIFGERKTPANTTLQPTGFEVNFKEPSSMKPVFGGKAKPQIEDSLIDVENQISSSELIGNAYSTMFDSIMSGFDMVRIKAATNANDTTRFFVNMGNQVISMIEQMIVKWALFNAISFLAGGGGVNFLTMFGLQGAHSGGNFIGTPNGVMKMAGGGSFTVPNGFPNDSFPLMVETGERVHVTPANQVPNSLNTRGIEQKLDILNRNLIGESLRRKDRIAIEGKTDIQNDAIRISYSKAEKVYQRFG